MKDLIGLMVLFFCMLLMSCSIFKHTTKKEPLEQEALERSLDGRSLVLKSALKETNTLTYNPDGSVFQFQRINEQVAQQEAAQVLVREKASVKKESVAEESKPMKIWAYIACGIAVLLLITFIFVPHDNYRL